jgi:hypothetical protein
MYYGKYTFQKRRSQEKNLVKPFVLLCDTKKWSTKALEGYHKGTQRKTEKIE